MSRYVLDCCTLLNLYCGWSGIQNLSQFGQEWHIGQVALSEAQYIREFGVNGQIVSQQIDPSHLLGQFSLKVLSDLSDEEASLRIKLAHMLDDGEAEGLALATYRGYTFCSDDKPVQEAATALKLPTPIVSTPDLLQVWASNDAQRTTMLRSVIRRITELSRFTPHRSSPHLSWWQQMLAASVEHKP
jgi:hypothetical protein